MTGDFTRDSFEAANRFRRVLLQQGRVQLDADFNEQSSILLRQGEILTTALLGRFGGPKNIIGDDGLWAANTGFLIAAGSSSGFKIGAGRYFVDGILCENFAEQEFFDQLDFPTPEGETLPTPPFLVYLEVFERSLAAVQDDAIAEPALEGLDTAARSRLIWQVKVLVQPANLTVPTAPIDDLAWNDWLRILDPPGRGTLRARTNSGVASDANPCIVPITSAFRGEDNQLYRVEIHDGGGLDTATFKWSRENGSVVVRWLGDKGSAVLVDGLGRDEVLGIAQGNLVELTSVLDDLAGTPGALVTVNGIEAAGADGTSLTLASAPPAFPGDAAHPKVRRWEDKQSVKAGWITLEDGVEVEFADGFYNTGDYWLIPARTATGDVEWPTDGGDPNASPPVPPSPLLRAPEGIAHGYCKLAALSFGDTWTVNEICRPLFPPLTDLPTGGVKEEPGIHVLGIHTVSGLPVQNDSPVPASVLAAGLDITCDGDVEPGTIEGKPTVLVALDLPYPLTTPEFDFWATAAHLREPWGTTSVTLDATTKAAGPHIQWTPSGQAAQVLTNVLRTTLSRPPFLRPRLLVHLTLKGNFIYAVEHASVNLDGEVFGVLQGSTLEVKLPRSGDGRRGGDLEMWFWLAPDDIIGIVVGVLPNAQTLNTTELRQATAQVFGLAVDRAKLREMIPAGFAVDATVQPDLEKARAASVGAGLQQQQLRVAIDDRFAGAGDLLAQQLGEIGLEVSLEPMPADAIAGQGAALAEQGFDVVIAGRDVIDRANEAAAGLLPPEQQVEL